MSDHHDPHHDTYTPAPWPPGEVSTSQKWSMQRLTEANTVFEPYEPPAPRQLRCLIFYLIQIGLIAWAAFHCF